MQLPHRIVLSIWLFSLLLCTAVVFGVQDRIAVERTQALKESEQEVAVLARAFEEHVLRSLESIDTSIQFMQNRLESKHVVTEDVQEMLRLLKKQPLLHFAAVVDSAGNFLADTREQLSHSNIADMPHIRIHKDNPSQGLFIGRPIIGRTTGELSIHLSRRYNLPDGSFGGVVVASVKPSYFSQYYEQMGLGTSHRVTLIGTDGIVRARSHETENAIGRQLSPDAILFQQIKNRPVGTIRSKGLILSDEVRINAYRQLPDYPLIVYVGLSENHALSLSNERAGRYYWYTALLILLILASTGFLSRMLKQNLDLLSSTRLALGQREEAEQLLLNHMQALEKSAYQTVQILASVAEMHDPYTAGHQQRSAELAVAIAKQMRLPADQIEELRVVAAIHDVGKLSVPGEILSKPARLSPLEYELAQTHAQAGYDILKNVDLPWNLSEIVLQHHEKYDGTGYPNGLSGRQILLSARILCVADALEAMLSHRPYRPALNVEDALAELEHLAGKWYDPDVVAACLQVFRINGFALEEL